MTTIRLRAALAATLLALLAGCSAEALPTDPIPVDQDGGTGTTDPLTLSYPVLTEASTSVPRWRELGEDFTAQLASWDAQCTPAEAGDPACSAGLEELRYSVNGIFTEWWAIDSSHWESGEYSGLVALEAVRDATIAAKASGSEWGCFSAESCVSSATAFHDDLTVLDRAFTAWRG